MLEKTACNKLPDCILKLTALNKGNFKIFKTHEGDLFQKLP